MCDGTPGLTVLQLADDSEKINIRFMSSNPNKRLSRQKKNNLPQQDALQLTALLNITQIFVYRYTLPIQYNFMTEVGFK